MIIEELTTVVKGRRVVYRTGDFYIYAGETESMRGVRVKITQIYADVFEGGVKAIYDKCDGSCTNVCKLEWLRPIPPLEQLAGVAE